MATRVDIPLRLRSEILIANRHACCICRKGGVQIHHINGDPGDNSPDNLAVLCFEHHDKATAPPGLSARLRPEEIVRYKVEWETQSKIRSLQVARSRTAFFMVDYKNCERIRQLYTSLSRQQFRFAAELLSEQLPKEHDLRKEQGFDRSLEPTTDWSPTIDSLLVEIANGVIHPKVFEGAPGHPKDPLYPTVEWQRGSFFLYDVWCQLMIRAVVAASWAFDLNELLRLDEPRQAQLEGSLVSFRGRLAGKVYAPDKWAEHPVGQTTLTVSQGNIAWKANLQLKTHYVYSVTGAMPLENGEENGLLLFRSIRKLSHLKHGTTVHFAATPLIIGSGASNVPGAE